MNPNLQFRCQCITHRAQVLEHHWIVLLRMMAKGRPGKSSIVRCLQCGAQGRTTAKYVNYLPDSKLTEKAA